MPNGGSDNCRTCRFNSINIKEGIDANYPEPRYDATCVIRKFLISNPLGTYCANFYSGNEQPEGPIFTGSFTIEGKRLPWYEHYNPTFFPEPSSCHICARKFNRGINIQIGDDAHIQFCCENHYMKWWKEANPDVTLPWKCSFKDPYEKRSWIVKGTIQYMTFEGARGVYRTNFRRIVARDEIEAAKFVLENIDQYLLNKKQITIAADPEWVSEPEVIEN